MEAYSLPSNIHSDDIEQPPTQDKTGSKDRDSGVFLSEDDENPAPSPFTRQPPIHLDRTSSTKSLPSNSLPTRLKSLRRATDLNIPPTHQPEVQIAKSELELQFERVRNSQAGSKSGLKSPTQLLKDRLSLTPKTKAHEIIRIFTPPRPMLNGCILPGPTAQMAAFTGKDVCARSEKGRPAWWCKFDKVVIFDGVEENEDRGVVFRTRSSKGLSVSRRLGDLETIIIPLDCLHCQEMLNRTEWKYGTQVCKRSVCWDCKERCRWELERESESGGEVVEKTARGRADSVLQDQQIREEELMERAGIESGLRSPTEIVGGIEERLDQE